MQKKCLRLLKILQFKRPQNSSVKKKKGAEQGADNVRRHAEYKGIVVQKQGSEVCEQQT